jgi:hypothetical protein
VRLEKSKEIVEVLEKDAMLFERWEIMDYSLLLVVLKKDPNLKGRHVVQGD